MLVNSSQTRRAYQSSTIGSCHTPIETREWYQLRRAHFTSMPIAELAKHYRAVLFVAATSCLLRRNSLQPDFKCVVHS